MFEAAFRMLLIDSLILYTFGMLTSISAMCSVETVSAANDIGCTVLATTGRWTSVDPIGYAAGDVNLKWISGNSSFCSSSSGLRAFRLPAPGEVGLTESAIPARVSGAVCRERMTYARCSIKKRCGRM